MLAEMQKPQRFSPVPSPRLVCESTHPPPHRKSMAAPGRAESWPPPEQIARWSLPH